MKRVMVRHGNILFLIFIWLRRSSFVEYQIDTSPEVS